MRIVPCVANPRIHALAESPFWDSARHQLLWVDIERGDVFAGTLGTDGLLAIAEQVSLGGRVGAVAAARDGGWIIAADEGLTLRARDGQPRVWMRILDSHGARRLNDGKPDPEGRYLVGTLSLADPSESEQLFVVDRHDSVRVVDHDLTQSNGLAWSPDGRLLYSVDTLRRRIYVRPYDARSTQWGSRELFTETVGDAYPDGICTDADGHLWVAMWGGGEVRRYSPFGDFVDSIEVPAPHISSVAFAGPLLDTLVITTARHGLSPEQIARYPDSGKIFTCQPGVLGITQSLWHGATGEPAMRAAP